MANKKFSEFTVKTSTSDVDFVVGYDGTDNVRITPANLTGGGGASSLNGLTDCLIDTDSVYLAEVPASLSGNPQGNLVVGVDAGNALTSGANNTLLGNDAGKNLTTTASNVIIGKNAGLAKTSGGNTVIIGTAAGRDTASGDYFVLIGSEAGISNTGSNAIAIGFEAGRVNTATSTISIGYHSGYSQTSGGSNTNLGYQAGYNNTTGGENVNVGNSAGKTATGSQNVAVGRNAFGDGFGHSGIGNVAMGYLALSAPSGASNNNVAIGSQALKGNGTKSNNVAVGYKSGFAATTGGNNVFVGYEAGVTLTTGDNNLILGNTATPSAITVDNEITLGNSSITALRCQIQTIAALSDSRDKTNIQPSTYGLDFINKLNPVTFDWNMRDGAKVGDKDLGFIAQELQQIDDENLQLVYANNPDRLEASYGRLIPVLVQAIKELKEEVELLKS